MALTLVFGASIIIGWSRCAGSESRRSLMKQLLAAILFMAIAVVSFVGDAHGTASEAGAIFLTIFPGARPTAMGAAFSSIADDATAPFYNPAGLGFQDVTQISLMHANWLTGLYPDMYYEYFGVSHPVTGLGSIGANIIYLTTGETQATDQHGIPLARFRTFDLSAGVSYGVRLREELSVGVGVKFIYSYLAPGWLIAYMYDEPGGGAGTSWGADVGVLYKTPVRGLQLASALQNFGPDMRYLQGGDTDPLPRTLRAGFSYRIIDKDPNWLMVSGEIISILVGVTESFNETWRDAWKCGGLEYTYGGFLSARAGYFRDDNGVRKGPTFGGGIKIRGFEFDIGVDSELYEFETDNYRFSVNYKFD